MSSGRLAQGSLTANAGLVLYTVPDGYYSSVSLNILNTGGSACTYDLAVLNVDVSTPVANDYFELEMPIAGKNVVERTGVVLGEGQSLYIKSSASTLTVNVYGIEQQL